MRPAEFCLPHIQACRAIRSLLAASFLLGSLTACASFSGSAKPVVPLRSRLDAVSALPESDALRRFASPDDAVRSGLDQKSYRNYVAAIYLRAADARYAAFRTRLSREAKGASFGANAAVLVMNGAAIVSGVEGARALAAAAAVTSGTYATFSKEVLYEKTLQAMLAAMDAQRALARGQLAAGLLLPADQYSLGDALADIERVEEQASLDVAVQHITALATADAKKQEAAVHSVFQVGVLREDTETRLAALNSFVETLAASTIQADKDMLEAMANALGVKGATFAQSAGNLKTALQSPAITDHIDATYDKLKPITHKDVY
jgi:hypothetical protein